MGKLPPQLHLEECVFVFLGLQILLSYKQLLILDRFDQPHVPIAHLGDLAYLAVLFLVAFAQITRQRKHYFLTAL